MKLPKFVKRPAEKTVPEEDTVARLSRLAGEEIPSDRALTRREYRLTGKGRYQLDPVTRKLTPFGKQVRLKHRLNIAMIVLGVLIIATYLILFLL
jgi:hypothetical protein